MVGTNADTQKRKSVQLSRDMRYILVCICQGPTSTLCKQNGLRGVGLETRRQLNLRFVVPTGARSVGYLTKLLKPQNFEDTFTSWEFEVARYERESSTLIPPRATSKLKLWSMRQKEPYSNPYSSEQGKSTHRSTVQQPHLHACNSSSNTTTVQHPWTLEQHTKDTE